MKHTESRRRRAALVGSLTWEKASCMRILLGVRSHANPSSPKASYCIYDTYSLRARFFVCFLLFGGAFSREKKEKKLTLTTITRASPATRLPADTFHTFRGVYSLAPPPPRSPPADLKARALSLPCYTAAPLPLFSPARADAAADSRSLDALRSYVRSGGAFRNSDDIFSLAEVVRGLARCGRQGEVGRFPNMFIHASTQWRRVRVFFLLSVGWGQRRRRASSEETDVFRRALC